MVPEDSISNWLEEVPEIARPETLSRLRQLASDTKSGSVQFLCGAGMSKASGLPLANDLVAMMAGEMLEGLRPQKPYGTSLKELASLYPLEAVAEAYLRKYDRPRMKRALTEGFELAVGKPHAGHQALEYFATQEYIDKVYTTNFDTLLEEGFSGRGHIIVDENVEEIRSEQEKGRIPVLHLHGTLDRDFLIDESSTYSLNTPLASLMRADMVIHRFVWVGYSMSDVDLRAMYLSMRDMLRTVRLAKRPFVVHPLREVAESKEVEWRLAESVWDARGAVFIPGSAETFLPALHLEVRRSAADDVARKLVRKKGGNPGDQRELDQVWKDARELAGENLLGDEIEALHEIAKGYGAG